MQAQDRSVFQNVLMVYFPVVAAQSTYGNRALGEGRWEFVFLGA
jgi:hypothetical protein